MHIQEVEQYSNHQIFQFFCCFVLLQLYCDISIVIVLNMTKCPCVYTNDTMLEYHKV